MKRIWYVLLASGFTTILVVIAPVSIGANQSREITLAMIGRLKIGMCCREQQMWMKNNITDSTVEYLKCDLRGFKSPKDETLTEIVT